MTLCPLNQSTCPRVKTYGYIFIEYIDTRLNFRYFWSFLDDQNRDFSLCFFYSEKFFSTHMARVSTHNKIQNFTFHFII